MTDMDKNKNRLSKGLGTSSSLRSTAEKIDSRYESTISSFFSPLTSSHYQEPPEPPEGNVVLDDESGETYISPLVEKKWVCQYFYSPERKARLYRYMLISVIAVAISSVVAVSLDIPGSIASIVVTSFIFLNIMCRYFGFAVYNRPMPELPVLSYLETREPSVDEDDENDDEDGVEYISQVDNINNGEMSPATYLTRWMNNTAHMSRSEFIESSGGKIDEFKMNLLLSDNKEAWSDAGIVERVSEITNSHPDDWYSALTKWEGSNVE